MARHRFLSEFAASLGERQVDGGPRPPNSLLQFPAELPPSHPYADVVESSGSIGTTAKIIINQSATRRNFLAIRNASPAAEVIFVSFYGLATTSSWLRLTANQIALFDTVVPQGNVSVISDSATGVVSWGFATLPRFIFEEEAEWLKSRRQWMDQMRASRPTSSRT